MSFPTEIALSKGGLRTFRRIADGCTARRLDPYVVSLDPCKRAAGERRMSWSKRRWRRAAVGDSGEVSEAERRRQLFSTIVPIYDQVNEVMSLGQHMEWKRLCVQYSGARIGSHVLDVCCGSGDLTQLLAERVGAHGKVVGLDFSSEMLSLAETRAREKSNSGAAIEWVGGDAHRLPFSDASFDAATVGYGLRNVTNIPQVLEELHRVLKPGAKISILDFNSSSNSLVDTFQELALQYVVVPVASLAGMEAEYKYLRESIKRFPKGPEQERLAQVSGFAQAKHFEIAGGLMGILVAQKRIP